MSNLTQSFQCPNEYVDYFCQRLTGAEFKILILATRKITGWPTHRRSMTDCISYSQFTKLTGITDKTTIAKSLKKLSKLGILKAQEGKKHNGQLYKIVRFINRAGQQEIFDDQNSTGRETRPLRSGNQTAPVGKPDTQNPNRNPINKNTRTATPFKKSLKKQLEIKFTDPAKAADHLREIAANGSEGKEAARITLMILEQLWKWHDDKKKANDELLKSWAWLFYASAMWPNIVQRAWGEVKGQKLEGAKMKKPGAILTLKIKEMTNE